MFRSGKGGFNASIVNKLFTKARMKPYKTKVNTSSGKATRQAYKANKKNWEANVKTAKQATKAAAKAAKTQAKIDKKLDKALGIKPKGRFKPTAKAKRLDNLKAVINPNTALGKKIQEKYNITDLDAWVEKYGNHIQGIKPMLKTVFQRSKDKKTNVDFLVKRYIKNPTINNLTNMENALSKAMDTTQRQAWKAFVKNMATFLPIGMAAAMVVASDD